MSPQREASGRWAVAGLDEILYRYTDDTATSIHRDHLTDESFTALWLLVDEAGRAATLDRAVNLVRRMRAQHHRSGSYAAGHLIGEVDDFLSDLLPPSPVPTGEGTGA